MGSRQTKKITILQRACHYGLSKRTMERLVWLEKNYPSFAALWEHSPKKDCLFGSMYSHHRYASVQEREVLSPALLERLARSILRARQRGDAEELRLAYQAAWDALAVVFWTPQGSFGPDGESLRGWVEGTKYAKVKNFRLADLREADEHYLPDGRSEPTGYDDPHPKAYDMVSEREKDLVKIRKRGRAVLD